MVVNSSELNLIILQHIYNVSYKGWIVPTFPSCTVCFGWTKTYLQQTFCFMTFLFVHYSIYDDQYLWVHMKCFLNPQFLSCFPSPSLVSTNSLFYKERFYSHLLLTQLYRLGLGGVGNTSLTISWCLKIHDFVLFLIQMIFIISRHNLHFNCKWDWSLTDWAFLSSTRHFSFHPANE